MEETLEKYKDRLEAPENGAEAWKVLLSVLGVGGSITCIFVCFCECKVKVRRWKIITFLCGGKRQAACANEQYELQTRNAVFTV